MIETKSGILPERIELTSSELDIVAGGNFGALAKAEIKQRNSNYVAIGTFNTVTTGTGGVSVGTSNTVDTTQTNDNSGNVTATATNSGAVSGT